MSAEGAQVQRRLDGRWHVWHWSGDPDFQRKQERRYKGSFASLEEALTAAHDASKTEIEVIEMPDEQWAWDIAVAEFRMWLRLRQSRQFRQQLLAAATEGYCIFCGNEAATATCGCWTEAKK